MSASTNLAVRSRLAQRNGFVLDVDIVLTPGITVLFGPSGAGKSTLLSVIAGIVMPDTGRITSGDTVLHDSASGLSVPPHARRIAYVFQSLALFPHMTAVTNVAYGIDRRLSRAERHARAIATLDRFGGGHLADRYPATLSGGEAQRVALARALATEPRAVLLDEPFAALDNTLRRAFIQDVRDLVVSLQVPIVHVTHRRREAIALGDRVLKMENGRVVSSGDPTILQHGDDD